LTPTRTERRAERRIALYTQRRDRAPSAYGRLAAAIDLLRGWAAEQARTGRHDLIDAAARAVASIPYELEEGRTRGDRHPPPGHGQ